jgi:hypothetical protein
MTQVHITLYYIKWYYNWHEGRYYNIILLQAISYMTKYGIIYDTIWHHTTSRSTRSDIIWQDFTNDIICEINMTSYDFSCHYMDRMTRSNMTSYMTPGDISRHHVPSDKIWNYMTSYTTWSDITTWKNMIIKDIMCATTWHRTYIKWYRMTSHHIT